MKRGRWGEETRSITKRCKRVRRHITSCASNKVLRSRFLCFWGKRSGSFNRFFLKHQTNKFNIHPGVAQLVARVVWDHEAAGSKPVTRTMLVVRKCNFFWNPLYIKGFRFFQSRFLGLIFSATFCPIFWPYRTRTNPLKFSPYSFTETLEFFLFVIWSVTN